MKHSLIAVLVSSALSPAFAAEVNAQEDAYEIEKIEVSGFRSSVIRARDIKQSAMIAQDSIVAQDIADFPDLNLADALQRVPGIAITREGGEGRQVSLRGLGPDFTRVQVNNMEALGTSSSPMDARGAVGRSRAFDFNIFASELFNQIDIRKSYSADQEEGGIAGTINLQTARPFDYDGFKAATSAQLGTNSQTDSTDPRFAVMVSNTWSDFGLLGSIAYSSRETNEQGTNTTRWRREGGKTAADPNDIELQAALDSNELWFPRGHRYSVWENDQKRLGITLSAQYKPSNDFSLSLDYLRGHLENDLAEHHNAVKDNKIVNELEWIDNNGDKEVIYASYQDATWRNETRNDYNESLLEQLTLSIDWTLTPSLVMKALIGSSSSDYEQPKVHRAYIHARKQADIITDFRGDRFYGVSYSPNFDVNSIDGFEVRELRFEENYIYSDFDNAKADFDYFLDNDDTVSFGINYKKFTNSGFNLEKNGFPKNGLSPLKEDDVTLTPGMVEIFSGHEDRSWIIANLDATQRHYGLDGFQLGDEFINENSKYKVVEETIAAYSKYSLEMNIGDMPLRAEFGLRYYETELTSEGLSQGTPTSLTKEYSDVLPSVNMVLELNDDLLWRFGASNNVTRPSLSALSFSANVSQTSLDEGDIGVIGVGNPNLNPFESTNFDTSLEWYFGEVGVVSVAVFYKDIKNFIVTETDQITYSELGLPANLLPEGKTVDDIFNVTSPQNSDETEIKGAELSVQRDLDFLPAPFNHLGVIANVTWADGSTLYRNVQGTGLAQSKSFPGLSDTSYNFTLYYEAEQWGGRIAAAYRSDYITRVEAGLGDEDERGFHASTFVDLSAYYWVSENVKVNFEGINLTDVREELYSDSSDRAYNTTTSGRTFMLGATVQF
ncbi:TonB-dependent receptor [Aestuariibacter sp. A3R04]|uniref:TonB-dependent receptor n=1 Tax=Aestuariibacter sp. A3R04 TaxID=2841571 RepID=UPI001C099091|nr:TonB-dependent receptor [Aestuariibacter sp. A3R04]MBU3020668.1 TonB-dependent receptor [Aestuariibacter sp. A3R04]